MSRSVIARTRDQFVLEAFEEDRLLMFRRLAERDNANLSRGLGMNNRYHQPLQQTKSDKALLRIVEAVVFVCEGRTIGNPWRVHKIEAVRGIAHTPEGYAPWFSHVERRSAGVTILCGHWSTIDLMLSPNVLMLDSGCLWGGTLTAIRLDDRRLFQVPGRSSLRPHG
jgi:hypothetical protein